MLNAKVGKVLVELGIVVHWFIFDYALTLSSGAISKSM